MQHLQSLLAHFGNSMDVKVPPPIPASSNSSEPVMQAYWDMAVNKLLTFDQTSGVAEWDVYYRLFWTDERMAYNGTAIFGPGWRAMSDFVAMEDNEIWTPDVVPFKSSGSSLESFGCSVYDDEYRQERGFNVLWTRPGSVRVHCDMNLQNFPFDAQQCTFIVGPWADRSYSLKALHEGNSTNPFKGDHSSEEWEVIGTWSESVTQTYINGDFEEVHYSMVFRRFPHYYLVNAVLPMALVVVLSSLTMWLPIEGGSGERLGFSVTLLLTIMATALFTAEFRPATREDTWLDRYQACCMGLTFFPVFESVLVVWLQFIYEKVRDSGSDEEDEQEELGTSSVRVSGGSAARAGATTPEVDEAACTSRTSDASDAHPRRRSRMLTTMHSLARFNTAVNGVHKSARHVMKAGFRMKFIVFLLHKVPAIEWFFAGKGDPRGGNSMNPRSVDLLLRYVFIVTVMVAALVMFSEVPSMDSGTSVSILLPPVYMGLTFYLLSAASAAGFLIFRISVLCSERVVKKAKKMREEQRDERRRRKMEKELSTSSTGSDAPVGIPVDGKDREKEASLGIVVAEDTGTVCDPTTESRRSPSEPICEEPEVAVEEAPELARGSSEPPERPKFVDSRLSTPEEVESKQRLEEVMAQWQACDKAPDSARSGQLEHAATLPSERPQAKARMSSSTSLPAKVGAVAAVPPKDAQFRQPSKDSDVASEMPPHDPPIKEAVHQTTSPRWTSGGSASSAVGQHSGALSV